MAKEAGPSEFGGSTQRNTIAPPRTPKGHPGHTLDQLSAAEKLRLQYLTGQPGDSPTLDTTAPPDGGISFQGLSEEEAMEPEKYADRWR